MWTTHQVSLSSLHSAVILTFGSNKGVCVILGNEALTVVRQGTDNGTIVCLRKLSKF